MALYLFPIDHLPEGEVPTGRDVRLLQNTDYGPANGGWRLTDYPIRTWSNNNLANYPWKRPVASGIRSGKKAFMRSNSGVHSSGVGQSRYIIDSSLFVSPTTIHFIIGWRVTRFNTDVSVSHITVLTTRAAPNTNTWSRTRALREPRVNFGDDNARPYSVYMEYHFTLGDTPKLHIYEDNQLIGEEVLPTAALNLLRTRDFLVSCYPSAWNSNGIELSDLYVATDTPPINDEQYPSVENSSITSPLGPIRYEPIKLTATDNDFESIENGSSVEAILEAGIPSNQFPFQDHIYSESPEAAITLTLDYGDINPVDVVATHVSAAGAVDAGNGTLTSHYNGVDKRVVPITAGWDIGHTCVAAPGAVSSPVTLRIDTVEEAG